MLIQCPRYANSQLMTSGGLITFNSEGVAYIKDNSLGKALCGLPGFSEVPAPAKAKETKPKAKKAGGTK